MLKHSYGKFSLGDLQFKLPNEMCICPSEMDLKYGFELCTEDKQVKITLMGNDYAESAKESIESILDADDGKSYTKIKEIEERTIAGFHGYQLLYQCERTVNMECALDITNGKETPTFTIWARTKKEYGADALSRMLSIFQDTINGISSLAPTPPPKKTAKKLLLKLSYPQNLLTVLHEDDTFHAGISTEPTADIEAGLEYAIAQLQERQQEIIKKRYQARNTLNEIGKQYGLTGNRIREIEVKALYTLRTRPLVGYLVYGKKGYDTIKEEAKNRKPIEDASLLLEISIFNLDLSVRSANNLVRAGLRTIGDLVNLSAGQITAIKNLGEKNRTEIAHCLYKLGFTQSAWNAYIEQ